MYTRTDVCTHAKEVVGLEVGWLEQTHSATEWHPCLRVTAKGVEQTMGVRWTCIHVLMHVHIVIKMCELKWGDWDTTTVPHKSTQVSISLFKGGETDMVSQVDMYTCTDACTHFNQGVALQARMDWDTHTHTTTQGHWGFHVNYPEGVDLTCGSWVDINTCPDACTHSEQGVGSEIRWSGTQIHSATHRNPCFHVTMQRGWKSILKLRLT